MPQRNRLGVSLEGLKTVISSNTSISTIITSSKTVQEPDPNQQPTWQDLVCSLPHRLAWKITITQQPLRHPRWQQHPPYHQKHPLLIIASVALHPLSILVKAICLWKTSILGPSASSKLSSSITMMEVKGSLATTSPRDITALFLLISILGNTIHLAVRAQRRTLIFAPLILILYYRTQCTYTHTCPLTHLFLSSCATITPLNLPSFISSYLNKQVVSAYVRF